MQSLRKMRPNFSNDTIQCSQRGWSTKNLSSRNLCRTGEIILSNLLWTSNTCRIYVIMQLQKVLKKFLAKKLWTINKCGEYFVCACLVVATIPLCVDLSTFLSAPGGSFGCKQFLWSQQTANLVCSSNFSPSYYFTASVQSHLYVANCGDPDLDDLPQGRWPIVVSALHGSLVFYAPPEFLSSLILMVGPQMMRSFLSRVWLSSMQPTTFFAWISIPPEQAGMAENKSKGSWRKE